MKFEEKLIKLRKEKILSQEELAEKLEVTRQTISKWELGQSKPDMDKLVEMSKFFEVPVDSLTNENLDIENKVNVSSVQKKERKWLLYVFVIVLIVSIVTLVIRVNLQKEEEKANNKNNTGIFSIFTDMFSTMSSMGGSNFHNINFEGSTGTKAAIFVKSTLDDIISANKKDKKHIVTLIYNDIVTTDEEKIKEVKYSLKSENDYEVSIEYDDDGYVNKVILEDIYNKEKEEQEKRWFNQRFESDTGTKPTLFLDDTLDDIISVNKKNPEHIVTLVYNDIQTSDEAKIKEVKHSLDQFKKYEVSVDYDENGYVNKVILEDI